MTKDIKKQIDDLSTNKLIMLYKFLRYLIENNRGSANQIALAREIIDYIENKMNNDNISIPSGDLTEKEFNQAKNIYGGMRINSESYDDRHRSGFLEGAIGLGGFILVIIVIAILKGAFEIIVNLWNSGVLKVILGIAGISGLGYLCYKKGLFEKKEVKKQPEYTEKRNNVVSQDNVIKNNEKEKDKENSSSVASAILSGIKGLTVFSSAVVVFGTGFAHLNKHSKEFNTTPLAGVGEECRKIYENVARFIRVTDYEFANDYSEFENKGYMDYISPEIANNWYNYDYENNDYCYFIKGNYTWEALSHFCYGNYKFANHLRIYNCRFDSKDEVLHPGDVVFIPNVEKLEDYISEKKLIKK